MNSNEFLFCIKEAFGKLLKINKIQSGDFRDGRSDYSKHYLCADFCS